MTNAQWFGIAAAFIVTIVGCAILSIYQQRRKGS